MSGVTVHTAETADLISLNEVKDQLRIANSDSTHNTILGVCQSAATEIAKNYLQRSLVNRTLILFLDNIPYADDVLPDIEGITTGPYLTYRKREVRLPFSPLGSVSHVKTYDDDDTASTLATSKYYVDTAGDMGRVVLRTGETWPDMLRVANALEIKYVAGYGSAASSVPDPIRQGALVMAAHLFENPDLVVKGEGVAIVPSLVAACWNPYRISRFGVGYG
tara:strand:- start:4629 stop:5291 length:663 start_codon:yes stop_codon:yes gene_type:complete